MECAFCHHEIRAGEATCPACRRTVPPHEDRVVEGSIEPGDGTQLAYMPARDVSTSENRSLVPAAPMQSAIAKIARVSALAWQQPAVRSAVKTGASAVALTVALRVASRMLASQGGRQVAGQVAGASLLPTLAEVLQMGDGAQTTSRRRRANEVTETFIYMRRTVRS